MHHLSHSSPNNLRPTPLLQLKARHCALKATTDDLERAQAKLQAHGLHLTPRKDAARRLTAPSAPAHPTEAPTHQPPALTDVLQPPHPSLKDDVPDAWTTAAVQAWVSTFDMEIHESAKEVVRILQTSKVTTEGLPLAKLGRVTIKSLQSLVSIGAALAC